MRILYKRPGEHPRTMVIPDELSVMMDLVGGYIEAVKINDKTVMVCNEEGKLKHLEPNFALNKLEDIIVGPVFFIGDNGEEFCSIADEEAVRIGNKLIGGWAI